MPGRREIASLRLGCGPCAALPVVALRQLQARCFLLTYNASTQLECWSPGLHYSSSTWRVPIPPTTTAFAPRSQAKRLLFKSDAPQARPRAPANPRTHDSRKTARPTRLLSTTKSRPCPYEPTFLMRRGGSSLRHFPQARLGWGWLALRTGLIILLSPPCPRLNLRHPFSLPRFGWGKPTVPLPLCVRPRHPRARRPDWNLSNPRSPGLHRRCTSPRTSPPSPSPSRSRSSLSAPTRSRTEETAVWGRSRGTRPNTCLRLGTVRRLLYFLGRREGKES